jgi:hypothetical protein
VKGNAQHQHNNGKNDGQGWAGLRESSMVHALARLSHRRFRQETS